MLGSISAEIHVLRQAGCTVAGDRLLGGAVSRMAGFPFQHTRHTNVTVMAAALGASKLRWGADSRSRVSNLALSLLMVDGITFLPL